jgi:hypothetical protein
MREGDRAGVVVELVQLSVLLVAEDAVVEHDERDRQLAAHGGLELRPAAREAAVAGHADDRRLGCRDLGAER